MPTVICILILGLLAGSARAHGNDTHGLEPAWTFDPWIVLPLGMMAVLYCVGAARLARRVRQPVGMRSRIYLYGGGILALAGALLSPLHWLGEHLFTIHMIEHEFVMAVSAPLIVLSRPIGVLLWGLPGRARQVAGLVMRARVMRRLWDKLTGATSATLVHGVAIWAWHVPVLFDAAVTNTALHRLQHLSFFATAILFWWALVWRSNYGSAAWHLFFTMVHTSILGALIALAPRILYAQTQTAMAWGLTPLEDQQLAGVIMWVPGGTIYAAVAVTMLALWIRGSSDIKAQNV